MIDDELISETNRANMYKIAYNDAVKAYNEVNAENKLLIYTLDIMYAYIYNGCKDATCDELTEIYNNNKEFLDDMEKSFVEIVAKRENKKKGVSSDGEQ